MAISGAATGALIPLHMVLATISGDDGRPRVWSSEWLGMLCGPTPRLTIGVPDRFAGGKGLATEGFGVSFPPADLLVPPSLTALLTGAGEELLRQAGLGWRPGPVTGVPLVAGCPLQFECRPGRLKLRGGQALVQAEVAAIHAGGALLGADAWTEICRSRPWERLWHAAAEGALGGA